jgi:hypothetical protein
LLALTHPLTEYDVPWGTNHKLKRTRNTHNLAAETDETRNPRLHHSDSLHAKGVELFLRPCSCALSLSQKYRAVVR